MPDSPTPLYPKLFRIAWQLYSLVFRPGQLGIGGREEAYFFRLAEKVVRRKSYKIDGVGTRQFSSRVGRTSQSIDLFIDTAAILN